MFFCLWVTVPVEAIILSVECCGSVGDRSCGHVRVCVCTVRLLSLRQAEGNVRDILLYRYCLCGREREEKCERSRLKGCVSG